MFWDFFVLDSSTKLINSCEKGCVNQQKTLKHKQQNKKGGGENYVKYPKFITSKNLQIL